MENNENDTQGLTQDQDNKLMNKFNDSIKEEMTNKQLIWIIVQNSLLCIWSKIMVDVYDLITISFLGHLQGDKLKPFFIATLIQNIGFKGIGFGIIRTSNMLAARFFGMNKLYDFGQSINRGRIVIFLFSLLTLLVSIFSKPLLSWMFPDTNMSYVQSFLLHNSPSIFLNFQMVLFIIYLNSQNHYFLCTIIDTLSGITLYVIYKIFFSIYEDKVNASDDSPLILTAWCLNLFNFMQLLYYFLLIMFYRPSPQSCIIPNAKSFKGLGEFLSTSSHFILFFLSHFLAGEELNILVNLYYGENSTYFNAFSTAQKISFMLQKISMGFTFVVMNMTGALVTKKYNSLLARFTKIYAYFSSVVILLSLVLVISLADVIAPRLTDKKDLLDLIPTFIRLIVLSIIPYHIETSIQSILSGHNMQKKPALIGIVITVLGGFGIGSMFIFLFDCGVYGVFITVFIIELILAGINYYLYKNLPKEHEIGANTIDNNLLI